MSRASDGQLQALVEHALATQHVRAIERHVSPYSTSCTIEELSVTLETGRTLRLCFKDLDWAALLATAARVRPRFMYDPAREVLIYDRLLRRAELGTAHCYAAVADTAANHFWLLLEWLDAARLCHVGDLAAWNAAAAWLRRLHALPVDAAVDLPLVRYDAWFYQTWPQRAAERNPTSRALRHLRNRYASVIDRLLALPQAIIHGEYYPSNVLVQSVGASPRICPIDWETAGVGPALMDLAALTAGQWTDAQRRAMVIAYAGDAVDDPRLCESLDLCRLHQTVQWLGWPDGSWTAPPDQAGDWLAEAERLIQRLAL